MSCLISCLVFSNCFTPTLFFSFLCCLSIKYSWSWLSFWLPSWRNSWSCNILSLSLALVPIMPWLRVNLGIGSLPLQCCWSNLLVLNLIFLRCSLTFGFCKFVCGTTSDDLRVAVDLTSRISRLNRPFCGSPWMTLISSRHFSCVSFFCFLHLARRFLNHTCGQFQEFSYSHSLVMGRACLSIRLLLWVASWHTCPHHNLVDLALGIEPWSADVGVEH